MPRNPPLEIDPMDTKVIDAARSAFPPGPNRVVLGAVAPVP